MSNSLIQTPKAWVRAYIPSALASPLTIQSGYNVTSIIRNSIGNYTMNFSVPMNNSNYCFIGISNEITETATGQGLRNIIPKTFTNSGCTFEISSNSNGVLEEFQNGYMNIVVFGA
jgi:hypothetical protein